MTDTDPIEAIDPATIQTLSKEELVSVYERADTAIKDLTSTLKVVRDELFNKIDMNGEIINDFQLTKAERIDVTTTIEQAEEFGAVLEEVDLEQIPLDIARSMGAIKKSVDVAMLRKLVRKGSDIPGIAKTGYLIIKPVKIADVQEAV